MNKYRFNKDYTANVYGGVVGIQHRTFKKGQEVEGIEKGDYIQLNEIFDYSISIPKEYLVKLDLLKDVSKVLYKQMLLQKIGDEIKREKEALSRNNKIINTIILSSIAIGIYAMYYYHKTNK